jgi:hypothetical protein
MMSFQLLIIICINRQGDTKVGRLCLVHDVTAATNDADPLNGVVRRPAQPKHVRRGRASTGEENQYPCRVARRGHPPEEIKSQPFVLPPTAQDPMFVEGEFGTRQRRHKGSIRGVVAAPEANAAQVFFR